MKKHIVAALAVLVASAFACPPASAQASADGIAFIDSQAIIEQWPAARQAMETFQREVMEAQARVRGMEEDLVRMREEIEQQESTLSQEAMQQRLTAFQETMMEYQESVGRIEGEIEAAQQQRVEQLREQISTVVEQVRAERDLSLVLDRAASGVVAADSALDLTSVVLQRLQ